MVEEKPSVSVVPVESIVECSAFSERIRFCVANRRDHIQGFHAAGRFYEEAQLQAFSRFYTGDQVFLDIGANIGNHTIFMSKISKARRVVPFEVNPDAIAILKFNLLLNDCRNVDESYLGIGLSSREHRMTKSASYEDNLGGTRFEPSDTGEFVTMPADPLISHLPIGAIKIDVEGMETEVLEGLRATIARWRPAIFIELEDRHFDTFETWMRSFRYSVRQTFAPYIGKKEYIVVPA